MQTLESLSIVLRSQPLHERDRLVTFLTQDFGKITGVAKGAIHSKRFGGSLDFLTCSKIEFVKKENAEMVRIDKAVTYKEFRGLQLDYEKLVFASFATELILKLVEQDVELKELFQILSYFLYHLDEGKYSNLALLNIFLLKFLKYMGYAPSLQELLPSIQKFSLTDDEVTGIGKILSRSFKECVQEESNESSFESIKIFQAVSSFFYQNIPGIPAQGFKSWKILQERLFF